MQVSVIERLCLFTLALLVPCAASAASPSSSYGEMDAKAFADAPRQTYSLQDFSPRYRATLEISAVDEVFRPGVIRVYDKHSGAALLEVKSDELVLDVDTKTGQVKTNVQELPYGEQSVLIHDDFNFDGIQDLAIMDGQKSCYHGPSFQVFLGTAEGFAHSASFTELAQNYCAMFQFDKKTRQLSTMTKDGCCTHWFATYSVQGTEPVMQSETVIDQASPSGLTRETLSVNKNGKMVSSERVLWEEDEKREILLAFKLAPSGKRIIVFESGFTTGPYYAAVDGKGEVSLLYPQSDSETFYYDRAAKTLSFVRGDTTYRIVGDGRGVPSHMEVVVRGKTTVLKLMPGFVDGSLLKVGQALQSKP